MNRRGLRGARRQNAGVAAGILPNLLPGLTLWLRGDLGLSKAGPDVTQWSDQSGNGNHATTDAGQFNPTWTSNINGKGTLSYVAGERTTFLAFTAGLTALELFVVGKNADDTSSCAPCCFTADTNPNFLPLSTDRQIRDNTGSTSFQTTGFAPSAGGWSSPWIYGVVATSSEWTAYFNGTQVFTQASNTFGYTTRFVGQGRTTGAPMVGDIAEIVLCNAKLSAANRAGTIAYLKSRYGIP